jgi:hypothetical protein
VLVWHWWTGSTGYCPVIHKPCSRAHQPGDRRRGFLELAGCLVSTGVPAASSKPRSEADKPLPWSSPLAHFYFYAPIGEQSGHWVWAHPWAQTVHGSRALTDTGQHQRLLTARSASTGPEALIRNGIRSRSLRIRRLGVRIPPGALRVETETGRPRDVGGVWLFSTNQLLKGLPQPSELMGSVLLTGALAGAEPGLGGRGRARKVRSGHTKASSHGTQGTVPALPAGATITTSDATSGLMRHASRARAGVVCRAIAPAARPGTVRGHAPLPRSVLVQPLDSFRKCPATTAPRVRNGQRRWPS